MKVTLSFDFLGFNVRQYKVGKTHSGRKRNGSLLEFKTIIKPSKEKIKAHIKKIGDIIRSHKSSKQEVLIKELNPVIKGWCNYNRTVVSKEIFSYCDHIIYKQLKKWASEDTLPNPKNGLLINIGTH